MYTYIHTVNNSNATQLQPAQADRDHPSLMDLGQSSDTKTHFSLGSLKQQGLTMQLWHRASAMRWDLMDNWGAGALGNGWKILLEQGCSLSCSQGNLDPGKSVGSDWILHPESLSPFSQTWQSLEMKGFKEKRSIPDTQVIFHTGFSFLPASKASPVSSKWSSAWAASVQSWHCFWCKMPNESRVKIKCFAWMQHSRAQGFPTAPSRASLGARSNTVSNWARIWAFMSLCVVCASTDFIFSLVGL